MTHTRRAVECFALLAVLLLTLVGPVSAQNDEPAQDVVKLTDGTERTGAIVKEQDGYVWIDTGEDEPIFLSPDKITEIIWNDPPDAGPERQKLEDEYIIEPWERKDGVTRAVVLSAEGMVGMQMSAKPLREAIPMLREEGVDLVVLKINSGGGYLLEIQNLSDVLHYEYKEDFDLVGWVDVSISAAATATMTIEELYFEPGGNLGYIHSCWGGSCLGDSHPDDEVAARLRAVASRGGADPLLVSVMQSPAELSYSIESTTGNVTFYEDLTGEHELCDGSELVLLDSVQAEHVGLSSGTAKTLDELTVMLEQNHGTIEWIGKDIDDYDYPVSKAERHQILYREDFDYQEARFVDIVTKYQMQISSAMGVEPGKRGGFLRRAEAHFARIKQMIEINPNFGLFMATEEWVRRQEETINELRNE